MTADRVHFGGPDRPPRVLRDLLQGKIRDTPPGGEIYWVTYYFRDLELADALIAASDRGVKVRLCIEAFPRRRSANRAVIHRLAAHGLAGGLTIQDTRPGRFSPRGYQHQKLYIFSSPKPVALVGSFNPSGNNPEDPEVVADIGDQDRGHNLLVELIDSRIVTGLIEHADRLRRMGSSPLRRFLPAQNRVIRSSTTEIFIYPRLRSVAIESDLRKLRPGDEVSGAISHLKWGRLAAALLRATEAGVKVRLIVHDTHRRVPEQVVRRLTAAGVEISRYRHAANLPMHAKFIMLNSAQTSRRAYFGSFNFHERSRRYNDELLVRTGDKEIIDAFQRRFDEIEGEVQRQYKGGADGEDNRRVVPETCSRYT